MSNNAHLSRLLEARLYYFASVGAILAERHFDRLNCLMGAVLGRWTLQALNETLEESVD